MNNTLASLSDNELLTLKKWYSPLTKRQQDIIINSYSTKFAYHIVRLMLEVEQIMAEHDLDIQRNSDILKTIRNGEWTFEDIESWFDNKEKSLETLYANSTLPSRPNEAKIKALLMECLEMHYGSLETVIQISPQMSNLVDDLKRLVEKYS